MIGDTQTPKRAPSNGPLAHGVDNIHYRRIRPDDWHRLQLFHQRLSMDTIERRFHGAKRALSTPLAHRLTDLDPETDVAVIATTGTWGRIIGVARYCRISPTCAEVAFVVEDAYQHRGVGHHLMERLVEIARQHGLTEFVAQVLPGNLAALRLLQQVGESRSQWHDGEIDVHVRLGEEPAVVPDRSTPSLASHSADDAPGSLLA